MVTPPAVNPTYAKGWEVNSDHNIWHLGSLPGTSSEIVKANNKYMWAIVMNKRNVKDQDEFELDMDDLGWNIQAFLPPPSTQDSCFVYGPTYVNAHSASVFSTSITSPHWSLINFDGANASITGTAGHDVNVNAGSSAGHFVIYKTTGNPHDVLCSLTVVVDAVLPVEMQSLTAQVSGRNVNLSWITSSEENNSGFEVQRSSGTDNVWNVVGFVAGRGNSNVSNSYAFADNNLSSGRYKYRLRQIDFNGNSDLHLFNDDVVIGTPGRFHLSENYPNPFNPVTKINFDVPVAGMVKLKVFDVSGREISTLVNETKDPGYYTVTFDAGMFSSGVYFYRLEADGFVMSRKMMLIK